MHRKMKTGRVELGGQSQTERTCITYSLTKKQGVASTPEGGLDLG